MTAANKDAGRKKTDQAPSTHSPQLPSSHGDSAQVETPKDIKPDDAAWRDRTTRDISSGEATAREECLLDDAIELTFPASDPTAELPSSAASEKTAKCDDEDEQLLDEAIELTFPASDPIAVTPHDKLVVRPRL